MRYFIKRAWLYAVILFITVAVICGYIIEKRSNTRFVAEIASEEEMAEYNDAGNRIINGLININTADLEELISLEGIGEKTALAIIDYRTENGAFKSTDELTLVKGIGPKTLEAVQDKICAE